MGMASSLHFVIAACSLVACPCSEKSANRGSIEAVSLVLVSTTVCGT